MLRWNVLQMYKFVPKAVITLICIKTKLFWWACLKSDMAWKQSPVSIPLIIFTINVHRFITNGTVLRRNRFYGVEVGGGLVSNSLIRQWQCAVAPASIHAGLHSTRPQILLQRQRTCTGKITVLRARITFWVTAFTYDSWVSPAKTQLTLSVRRDCRSVGRVLSRDGSIWGYICIRP